MNKIVLLLVLVGAGVLAWLLIGDGGGNDEWDPDAYEDFTDDRESDPTLLGAEGAGPRPERPKAPTKTKSQLDRERRDAETRVYLKGRVVEKGTNTPIAGARLWFEFARNPCPRLPERSPKRMQLDHRLREANPDRVPFRDPTGAVSDKAGTFEWRVAAAELPRSRDFDIFAEAKGYVTAVLCRPEIGGEVTIEMAKGLTLPVTVSDTVGRPIENAKVTVRPAPGTEPLPGLAAIEVTDELGRCTLDGLVPGKVIVRADHPEYMPTDFGPIPHDQIESVEMNLAPALRLSFEIRSDDGSEIVNPVLVWKTDGKPPAEDLQLLKVTNNGPPANPKAEVKSEPVRIPCVDRNVQLELKADGFQPWRPEPEPLPPEGGARTIIASLTRDTSLAPLTIRFEDADGKPVPYRTLNAKLDAPVALDGQAVGAITLEAGETLDFPSLPPGRYQFGIRSARYAPAIFEANLVAGEKNEHVVKLAEPARMRIRFVAPERLMVRFRILRQGRVIKAFPLKADGEPASGEGALQAAGNEGSLFGGLPDGTVTIEVTNDDLIASATQVTLRGGDTTDVEIEVRRR